MREILFRGKQDNKWVYGYFIQALDIENKPIRNCIIENMSSVPIGGGCVKQDYYDIELNTLGQYIGLKDKNGTKIFEGDIVKRTFVGYESFESYTKLVVADLKTTFPEIFNDKDWTFDCEYEVIGNIYDNPELLGGENE